MRFPEVKGSANLANSCAATGEFAAAASDSVVAGARRRGPSPGRSRARRANPPPDKIRLGQARPPIASFLLRMEENLLASVVDETHPTSHSCPPACVRRPRLDGTRGRPDPADGGLMLADDARHRAPGLAALHPIIRSGSAARCACPAGTSPFPDLGPRQVVAGLPAGESCVRAAFSPTEALLALGVTTQHRTTEEQTRVPRNPPVLSVVAFATTARQSELQLDRGSKRFEGNRDRPLEFAAARQMGLAREVVRFLRQAVA